jgi:hypothetical protein
MFDVVQQEIEILEAHKALDRIIRTSLRDFV